MSCRMNLILNHRGLKTMNELIKAIEALLADVVPQGHEVKVSAYRVERVRRALEELEAGDD